MSKELMAFNSANLPAHLRDQQGVDKSWDEVGGGGFPRLKMKGMTLEAVMNGGVVASSEPGQPISVVLLKPSRLGRTYYEGAYTEGSKELPTCYSLDNVAPAPDAQQPQCSTCALCPMNVKGSGTVADTKACRYRQTLGVWLPGESTDDLIFQVNLPATSIFPDEENRQGFMPLQRYVRKLKNMKIDPSKIWTELVVDGYSDPKRILLKPVGYIEDPQDYEIVKGHLHSPELERILNTGPLDGEQTANEFGAVPEHMKPQTANKPVIPTGREDTVNPFTGEVIYEDNPEKDEADTYWKDDESGEVVKLIAGTNLPVEYPGITEVTLDDYTAWMNALQAKREAEEKAKREAAAAKTTTGTGRRRAAASEPAADPAPADTGTGRRRGAAASQTADPAPAAEAPATTGTGRRRAAATPAPEAAATGTGRRRAAATPAQPAQEAPAATGTGRRRGGGAAAAQQAAAGAPADEQPRVAGADLDPAMEDALNAALGGDME